MEKLSSMNPNLFRCFISNFNFRESFRVTILKNAQRKSRGVAFIQFLNGTDAKSCLELNNTQVKQSD